MDENDGIKVEDIGTTLCHGCLSRDRKLMNLGEFVEIYQKLCSYNESSMVPDSLCWECVTLLKKVKLFIAKVQRAQTILSFNFYKNISTQSLSNLKRRELYSISSDDTHELLDIIYAKEEEKHVPNLDIKIEPNYETNYQDLQDYDIYDNQDYDNDIDLKTVHEVKDEKLSKSLLQEFEKTKKDIREKRMRIRKSRYKLTYQCIGKIVRNVPIDGNEMESLREKEKSSDFFRKLVRKCELCLHRLRRDETTEGHYRKLHVKTSRSPYSCDICQGYLHSKTKLKTHIARHYYKKTCGVCEYECYSRQHMYHHIKSHEKQVVCLECGHCFVNTRAFYKHYRALHSKYICDYCNKVVRMKRTLERHMETRHSSNHCTECNVTFKSHEYLAKHRTLTHKIDRSEASFCVACDRQFDNVTKYKRHIQKSAAHASERNDTVKEQKRKQVKCPMCPNVYMRHYVMMQHYRMVHTDSTRYYCEKCDKYFLNRTRLVNHRRKNHEGYESPRNKICAVCGRGFTTNRILTNHMRTHTGERPYHCDYCDAKFAQQTAMQTHIKFIHLKLKRKP